MSSECARSDVHNVLTSDSMKFNHCFIISIIIISFFTTTKSVRVLLKQNLLPTCTRNLLFSAIINGIIHQCVTAVIRLRAFYHAIVYASDPCAILFQSSQCFFDGNLYYYTNLFSSFCCFSLFLDRLFSFKPRSSYHNHQTLASIVLILSQIVLPIGPLYWVFYDAFYTSYVLMCTYPPPMSVMKLHEVNNIRICVLIVLLFFAIFLYIHNKIREKRMVHNVYNINSRYKSYENYLATKSVCIVIFSQILCVGPTSSITSVFIRFRDSIPLEWFHLIISYLTGLTYSNFLLPLIILYQDKQIAKKRRIMIQRLQNKNETSFDHFDTLKSLWGKKTGNQETLF
ncbi:Serpentine receptor class alpha-28 [Caenorhabditis elegans]|uniref:Serpentine receptor class alpha-28 n=1 Tax=Caenorhabditis elegans TaxID=6239 RepID=SRA28_CAEEL|nr:Serpentine receptor class alpha-28 [Caenorhabditis elegans]Q19550.1 RecName: Full=Serpentine receptor class alpha-28; Short=Protein sra-28 [Caenorhabditis elegans]CCD68197.1 Serpentine receptor class alpha-28 [Caenorhabditis elegans]|eukprot:NP_495329.1 Serpentine receptor class alpha-28 [Caenorhabditis elegans]